MKIGIVGSIWMKTPPEKYGGTEIVVANLCNGLSAKGHDVTLFAPDNSNVHAKVVPTVPLSLREQGISWFEESYNLFHMSMAFAHKKQFDVLHVHLNKNQDYVGLSLALYSSTPVLFTPHFKIPTPSFKPDRYLLLNTYHCFPFTSISNTQRENYLNFIQTAYNSIKIEDYPFVESPDDYFVWLGKILPVKGTKEAILTAKKAGVTLYVLGAIENGTPEGLRYFHEEVEPLLDNKQIIFYENVGLPEKAQLLGHAKAFLNPILWDEPFGLVMIEAQATGTPVISYNRGAAPELIAEGQTGFLVENEAEMIAAMGKVDTIDRTSCRAHVVTHSTTEQMISSYEKAYEETIHNWKSYQEQQQHHLEEVKKNLPPPLYQKV